MSGCTAQRDAQTDGGLQDNAFMDDPFEDDEQFEEVHCSDCCGGGGSSCVGRGMSFERQRTEWKRLDPFGLKAAMFWLKRDQVCFLFGSHSSRASPKRHLVNPLGQGCLHLVNPLGTGVFRG